MFVVATNLYVGNLAAADAGELECLLERFGVVRFAAFVAPEAGSPCDGFGVVEMGSEREAAAAIRTLHGFEIRGRPLTVRWATPPERTACGHPKMFGTMNMK